MKFYDILNNGAYMTGKHLLSNYFSDSNETKKKNEKKEKNKNKTSATI